MLHPEGSNNGHGLAIEQATTQLGYAYVRSSRKPLPYFSFLD